MHSIQDLEQCTKIAELVSFQTLHILKATDGHPCSDKNRVRRHYDSKSNLRSHFPVTKTALPSIKPARLLPPTSVIETKQELYETP
jgi:hypothetical protein